MAPIEQAQELLTVYTKAAPHEPVMLERKDYYDNAFTTHLQYFPALVDVILLNGHGDLLLQKRGRAKRLNPGKLHVTVGGHVNWGEQPSFSVIHECIEELGAPAMVFSRENFDQGFTKLEAYARKMALLCESGEFFRDYQNDLVEERRDIKDRIWFYLGRYDGPIDIPDRASAGYEWIDLETLKKEFIAHPEQFTATLKLYVQDYGDRIAEFAKKYCRA